MEIARPYAGFSTALKNAAATMLRPREEDTEEVHAHAVHGKRRELRIVVSIERERKQLAASATAAYVVVAMTRAVSSARRSTARTSRSLPRAYALLASGWMPCAMPTNRALATNAKFATTP